MAGYKETPRQKMIGMLYLVLTALLALNVSKDILNAFVTVNAGLVQTNETFLNKNNSLMAEFERQLAQQEERVKPFYDKAVEARRLTEEMVLYIQDLSADVIAYTEFNVKPENNNSHRQSERWRQAREIDLADVKKQDNYNKPMIVMGVSKVEHIPTGRARQLRDKIWEYRDAMLMLLDDNQRDNVPLGFDYTPAWNKHYKKEMEWEFNTFYYTVLAAHSVIFNKIIAEVRNVESGIITQLMGNISRTDFKFDAIDAAVVPVSMMVPQGSPYEATLFVAAFDTKTPIRAVVNGQTLTGDSGRVFFRETAGAEGTKNISGEIFVFDPSTGVERPYPFQTSYTVFKPMATVAATSMNVFYRGLENPVSVSVPGYSAANVSVSISGGHKITSKGGGNYIVEPGAGRDAVITVTAGGRTMGTANFRIRNVPRPQATFAGSTGGNIDKQQIIGGPVARANMGDFVFENVRFTIQSFNFVMAERSGVLSTLPQRGDRLDAAAIAKVQAAARGQRIFIENIMARGPDGQTQNLGSVILRIN